MPDFFQETTSSNNVMVAGIAISSAALVLMMIGVLLGFCWHRKTRVELRKDREKHDPRPPARKRIFLRRVLDTHEHKEVTNPVRGTDVARVPANGADHHAPRSPQMISIDVPTQHQLASRSTNELPSDIINCYFERQIREEGSRS